MSPTNLHVMSKQPSPGAVQILGPFLLACFVELFLYAILTLQYFAYWYRGEDFNDSRWIKLPVCILFVMDTGHTVVMAYSTYALSRKNYYYPEDLLNPVWSYIVSIIIFSTTAFVVHIFLTYRIYRLTGCNKFIGGFIVLLTLGSGAVGICTTVSLTGLGTLAKAVSLKPLFSFWLSFNAGLDFFLAIILIYLLLRSRSGFQKSNSVIHRLVRAAAQTGILVAICTLTSHILFLKYPTLHYYGILGLPAGRLYGMSIMDTLLVRHSLREKVKGGRTPTSAIWEIEDLGWPLGRKTSAKGPTALRFPVLAIES